MMESLKKSLLAGLGVVAFTKEKLEKVLQEMVERGELTRDQQKHLLRQLWERGQEEGKGLVDRLTKRIERWLASGPVVTREEHEALRERVAKLESRAIMDAAETGAGESPASELS